MKFARFLIVIPALLLLTACGTQEPGTERIGGEQQQSEPGTQMGGTGQPDGQPGGTQEKSEQPGAEKPAG